MSTQQPLRAEDIAPEFRQQIFKQDYSKKPTIDGVRIVDLPSFSDDGGYFLELTRFVTGHPTAFPDFELKQMNYSEMDPGVVKAAHLHFQQEDIWFVPPTQKLLIGLMDCRDTSPTKGMKMRFVMGAKKAKLLYIPRGVAHGAANLWQRPAAIIYFVNNVFDADPEKTDEHRLPWDVFGADFWEIQKG
ncbi:MAG: dTDP-4-dehydrorhamnose 3,5-epimerase family protein [Candidatus Kerfeldbacteria bacterium]|nr:dTDP-4-dehydrorhamnose 3,5-epimerase family protein [Candidatus Kerfeldbacteria bacterium]